MARELTDAGARVLVVEKRNRVAGNCHTRQVEGVVVHDHGPHIFHTNSENAWRYANRFARFYEHRTSVVACFEDKILSFPINMMTFYQVYGVKTPSEAMRIVAQDAPSSINNMRDSCIARMGKKMYETIVEGYTTKQWGKPPEQLPVSIGRRIPVRFTYDSRRFNSRFEGLPDGGYTPMVERMLAGIEVWMDVDYLASKGDLPRADKIVYSGPIDALFEYDQGHLEYRSLRFETFVNQGGSQGVECVNYTGLECDHTRVVEYNYFMEKPILSPSVGAVEYPSSAGEPYYPINDDKNNRLAKSYKDRAEQMGIIVGGRLGSYKYLDMDAAIAMAFVDSQRETGP